MRPDLLPVVIGRAVLPVTNIDDTIHICRTHTHCNRDSVIYYGDGATGTITALVVALIGVRVIWALGTI